MESEIGLDLYSRHRKSGRSIGSQDGSEVAGTFRHDLKGPAQDWSEIQEAHAVQLIADERHHFGGECCSA